MSHLCHSPRGHGRRHGSQLLGARLGRRGGLLRAHRRHCRAGGPGQGEGHRGLLPGQPRRRMVPHRRLDLRFEHRRRAPGGPCRHRGGIGHGVRPLGTALLPLRAAWLGVCAVLPARGNLHHPGISGEALHDGHAHGAVAGVDGRLRPHQGLGDDLRRGRGHLHDPRLPARIDHRSAARRADRLLLVLRVHAGDRDRRLHRHRRDEGGVVDRRPPGASAAHRVARHPGRGPGPDRRPRGPARGECRNDPPVATAVHDAGHAGFPRVPLRPERDAVARCDARLAHHRALVLVHRPVHRAAGAHREEPQGGPPRRVVGGVSQALPALHLPACPA